MSKSNGSPGLSRAERRVQDELDRLHHQRKEFRRGLQLQQVSQEMHLQFQQAVLDVYDELRPYRDEVEEEWADATPYDGGLDELPKLADRTQTRRSTTVQMGHIRRETTSAPVPVPPKDLLEASYDLDDIARELDLGLNVSSRPHANYSS